MTEFAGRVVLISGPAGGLGMPVVAAFRQASASLALIDRAPDRLQRVFPDLVDVPAHLLLPRVDANDPDAVEAAVKETIDYFGRIDVLVNTVGGYRAGQPVHATPLETWDNMLALNARTAFILSRAVVPQMLAQGGGKLIHVASRAAQQGSRNAAAYSASKAALLRLVESLAAELRDANINVNCVLPGTIDTPDNREAMPDADVSRWVPPAAIADVILFLASEAARAVNGAAIPVYGRS